MNRSTNGEARPGEAERPHESGAASPGRGGRMSRQRKTSAVLRLLRGEDLETISRSLGVTAATLSGWRDAFLAAGEAILTTKPATGEALVLMTQRQMGFWNPFWFEWKAAAYAALSSARRDATN